MNRNRSNETEIYTERKSYLSQQRLIVHLNCRVIWSAMHHWNIHSFIKRRFFDNAFYIWWEHKSTFSMLESFCLNVNPKHYSNTLESIRVIEEVIIPYLNAQREILSNPNQAVWLQMTLPRIYCKKTFILSQSQITWQIYSNH